MELLRLGTQSQLDAFNFCNNKPVGAAYMSQVKHECVPGFTSNSKRDVLFIHTQPDGTGGFVSEHIRAASSSPPSTSVHMLSDPSLTSWRCTDQMGQSEPYGGVVSGHI